MFDKDIPVLLSIFKKYRNNEQIAAIATELKNGCSKRESNLITAHKLNLYQRTIPIIENNIWSVEYDKDSFAEYQSLCREMERHFSATESDVRHHIVIVIPIADRPQHLQTCMNSIFELCETFEYGGKIGNTYQRISVIIADDSQDVSNIQQHRKLAKYYTKKGIKTEYLGLDEQIQQLQKLKQKELSSILGYVDLHAFYHKGASIIRNIAYLRLNQLAKKQDNLLFYFIDSDQEFRLNLPSKPDKNIIGLNYFYHLDKLFLEQEIKLLTGKVVGDPPVSPSVMASNLLKDIALFLEAVSSVSPQSQCQFHYDDSCKDNNSGDDDAAYHDMADLFGFKKRLASFNYTCPLASEHNHIDCFRHFARRVNHFFDGEHPTRRLFFQYKNIRDSLTPARTVYTGNYVFVPEMLEYFIPFAPLKLRMAGPVLGRLIKAEIGDRFVSVNLPMLHKRTVDEIGQSEYRPGVKHQNGTIDLSNEFICQFFGDVMLFTIEALTEQGYPDNYLDEDVIAAVIKNTEKHLLQQYQAQHAQIKTRLLELTAIYSNKDRWWNNQKTLAPALDSIKQFIHNMETNFGKHAKAYQAIQDGSVKKLNTQHILEAIIAYPASKQRWKQCLENG